MLRQMRRHFGMAAPRVTVRAHVPWYWRALVMVATLAVAMVMAGWVFDIGRRFAGFDKNKSEQELSELRERVASLETEHNRNSSSEASLEIERTARQRLGEQLKAIEAENARMREELATFESLASGTVKTEAANIHRLQVEADSKVAGAFRYRMLLSAPSGVNDHEFKGHLQIAALVQQGDKTAMVDIPDTAKPGQQWFLLSFKYFRRVEGNFVLPAGTTLKRLDVRLMQGTVVVASQQVSM